MTATREPVSRHVLLARHDLLILAAADWARVAATREPRPMLDEAAAALLGGWAQEGWPVVVRRGVAGNGLAVGVPLPPSLGKARIAMVVPPDVPVEGVPPVRLADARGVPPAWRPTLDAILALAASLDLVPHLYGALLWQSLTGLPYLTPTSDLDLLWRPRADRDARALAVALGDIDASAPMRLDGEFLTPRGGVAWREFAAASPEDPVLAKTREGAALVEARDLFRMDHAS